MDDINKAADRLKEIYDNTPNDVKRRAWQVFGHTDSYFREIVSGKKKKSLDSLCSAIQALKQAYSDCKKTYIEDYESSQEQVELLHFDVEGIVRKKDSVPA